MLRSRRFALGALIVLVVIRFAIVATWHQPGGDGVQYYSLATQLRSNHTFGFQADTPSHARLPGYPLFLAFLADPMRSVSFWMHVRTATIANVILDILSAFLLWRTARVLGLRKAVFVGVSFLLLPTLWLMSCYAMTETLSTALVTAELYFAIRILRQGRVRLAVAVGLIAGFAQLVRLDAVCALPMVVYSCLRAPVSTRRRIGLTAAFATTALLVFAPWPIRNTVRFGRPYFAASTTRTTTGIPFGDGLYEWARTWSSGADGYFELYLVYELPFIVDRRGAVPAPSYDNEDEKKQVVAAFLKYNEEGLTDAVDNEFHKLAKARFRKHPWRTLFVLPVMRIGHLLESEPDYDMPMRVRWLGIPFIRPIFGIVDLGLMLLALLGAVVAWRKARALFWLLAPAVLLRLCIYAFAVPHAATHRFLVEAFPILIVFAALAVTMRSPSRKRVQDSLDQIHGAQPPCAAVISSQ